MLTCWSPFLKVADKGIEIQHSVRGDVLIDDGIHNLEDGQYKKVLMTAPHNIRFDAEAHGMIRVRSWKEIEQVIEKLAAD